jgi:DNA-binding transcriptional LysR family regulator
MNQLEDMRYLESVDRNGFSAAAERLGVSKQLVSRRIAELEARLGVQLLVRTTRRLTPTDLGCDYLEHARRVLASVDEADQAMSRHRAAPRGSLRVSAPVSYGTMLLSELIAGFLARYRDVRVELDLNDRAIDLVAEGDDMAVRIGNLGDSTLVVRKLADLRMVICASPAYLRRRPAPRAREPEGPRLPALRPPARGVLGGQDDGSLKAVPMAAIYRTNNGELVRDAALAGLGLAQLPDFIVGDSLRSGELVTMLDDYAFRRAAYVVHPAHRQRSSTVRALTDYLVAHFQSAPV